MQPMRIHHGIVAPLDRANVDTDQIIPKQFLKRIERTGYGPFLFNDWRYDSAGNPRPDFLLNREPYTKATILLAGRNFGCGSSREHAAWALTDFGILVVIAPSFAELFARAAAHPGYQLTINVETLTLSDDHGWSAKFPLDPFRQHCLLNGLDQIGITLQHESAIAAFEAKPKPY